MHIALLRDNRPFYLTTGSLFAHVWLPYSSSEVWKLRSYITILDAYATHIARTRAEKIRTRAVNDADKWDTIWTHMALTDDGHMRENEMTFVRVHACEWNEAFVRVHAWEWNEIFMRVQILKYIK